MAQQEVRYCLNGWLVIVVARDHCRAMKYLLLMFIASLCATQVAAAGGDSCLEYGPTRLVGMLVRHTYAGPPDYESVTKGDEPGVVWVLQLDERVCVNANTRYPREPTQIEVELALPERRYAEYRHLLGRKVMASGELIHGGASYQKRLVLRTDQLQETSLLQR
jgi:hypothetical protein